ncbi:MAG TPA: hypothetical protein DCZ72_00180 [Armatimonadetes bacterium]|nr:hypothetical protein [Armatimonadota bacterium]
MAHNTIGVDVGGTKIYAILVDDEGQVLARAKMPTPLESGAAMMEAVKACIRTVGLKGAIEPSSVRGIGLGVPGVVSASGVCIWAPNCPLTGVDVAGGIRAEFGVAVEVGNDVNVGTLGELAFGAARGLADVFGMFVGTGIGGGLVVDGEVIVGEHALGAEIGHIVMDYHAALDGREGGGEFEYYAGRLGIERAIRAAIADGRETIVAERLGEEGTDRLRSGLLKTGVESNDEVVIEALTDAAKLIGLASANVILLCDPQALVMGGGVIEAVGDFMMPIIEETIRAHIPPGNGRPLALLTSQLGDDAVALGAAALVNSALIPEPAVEARVHASYPTVEGSQFGSILVDGKLRDRDLVVRADGEVRKRRKRLSRAKHGTAHEISIEEVKYVCRELPATFILGAGYEGLISLSRPAVRWLQKRDVQAIVLPTPEAARAFNETSGSKALLLHVGC